MRPSNTSVVKIEWACDRCGEMIADDEGWVTIPLLDVLTRQRVWDEWEAKQEPFAAVLLGEVMALPDEVKWQVLHRGCDPDPEEEAGDCYWFDIARIRTVGQVMDWWLHLSEKSWFGSTDWESLIRRHVLPQVEREPVR